MIALLASAAWAQQPAMLRNESELQECLDTPACETVFTTLLSESMLEMGYLFQHDGLAGSALTGKGNGLVFELEVHTGAVGPKNLVLENLRIPPAVPRFEIGYQVGSFTFDDPYPQYAVSVYALPPLTIDGYQVLSAGFTGSFSIPLGTHYAWAGAELDASYGSVKGPFVGDGDVIEDIEPIGSLIDVETPPCDSTPTGCIDRFRSIAVVPRIGVSLEPADPVFLYGKLGLGWLDGDIRVAYDESVWRMRGLQPQVSYGGGVRLGDRVQLTFGGVTATKREALSTDESRTLTRFMGSFSVRTGDTRYWSKDEVVEPPEPPSAPTEPSPDATPDEAGADGA